MPTNAPQPRTAVTAIIVAHDGARFLPGLAQALKAQTQPVGQTVGVDTGSSDGSEAVLAELIGRDAVVGMGRSTGFGEAVTAALRHAARQRSGRPASGPDAGPAGPGAARVEWIWLLHDDCEPAPDALEQLLRVASRDRTVVVVGPKVLDGQDRRTLREVGISIDRAGRRVTGIDPGEIDQGQHDHKRAVLAVSSAGMLVRRDVWDRLGGFDPNLKFFRDDLDFCWRVQAAGLRVHVATDAVVYHWELAGRRRRTVQGGTAPVMDQRNALFVLAVNLPLAPMLRIVGGCVLGSLARAFTFLVVKQLDLSAAYALAVLGLFAHPIRLLKGRRRRAKRRAEGYYAARIYIPPARTLAKLAEYIAWLASTGPSSGRHHTTADELEDEQFIDRVTVVRRVFGHPGVRLFLALLLVTLIATRRLLGTNPLGGGALVPAWGGALALWQEYLTGFHAVSVGSTAAAPPYLALVAAIATLLGGQTRLAVDVLLLGCVPLAGVTAYLATRAIATTTTARVLLAAAYAMAPVATGAVAAGRLGTATAFVLFPLIAVSAGRMLTAAPRQARRAAWATGLLISVAAAFAPLAWVFGVVFAAAALCVRRWLAAATPRSAAVVAVTPFFVLFPWSLHLLASPSAFLAEAGLSTPGLTTHGLGATALLALSPGGPGVPPVWVTAGFALALVALVLPTRRPAVLVGGWAVAITGLLAAAALSRLSVTPPSGGQPAAGWPGVAIALAALGLLLASAPSADWLAGIIQNGSGILSSAGSASGRGRRSRRLLAGAVVIGAATAPLLVAGYWVTAGVRGPVNRVSSQLLPTFISGSTAGEGYRTLILRPDGTGLDYQVVRQGDPSLGEPELGASAAAEAVLSRQVAALAAPDGADAGDPGLELGSFGIKWVMLPAPVNPALATRLDASLGLVALNKGPSYDIWQVTGPVGWLRVVGPSGATTVLSSGTTTAPAGGGTLILAEPYGGWTATLNGRALKPAAVPVGGWAQGFTLPSGGGHLSITHNGLPRLLSLILELVVTLTVTVAALPGKRADPAEEAEALTALREAKASAAGRRAAGAGRPRGGAGHRTVTRVVSGVDRIGLGRRRAPADDRPPESPALGTLSPAESGAEPAEHAMAAAATARTALAARADGGRGRHRGARADSSVGDAGEPAAPELAAPASSRWGTGPLTLPGNAATDVGGPGDGDWLEELLRKNGLGQPPAAVPSAASASSGRETGSLDTPEGTVTDAGQGAGTDRQPPLSTGPAADPLDTSALPSGAERLADLALRRPTSWKGALARLTGQQAAVPEGAEAEPVPDTAKPLAHSGRHAAAVGQGALSDPPVPVSSPRESSRPEGPALGGPVPQAPPAAQESAPESRPPWESTEPASPAKGRSAWGTEAKSAWGTGPLPAAPARRPPASRTQTRPTFTPTGAPTGPQPTFTPTGPRPSFTPAVGQPSFTPTGGQPASTPSGPRPTFTSTGGQPISSSAGSAHAAASPPAEPDGSSVEPGTASVEKPPWESHGWDRAADSDASAGGREAALMARGLGSGSEPDDEKRSAAGLPAKPERHSHRGGKHGKSGRWRGSGGHPTGDGKS